VGFSGQMAAGRSLGALSSLTLLSSP
jgi:hypothetical protein